jgi:hypothetical protein
VPCQLLGLLGQVFLSSLVDGLVRSAVIEQLSPARAAAIAVELMIWTYVFN